MSDSSNCLICAREHEESEPCLVCGHTGFLHWRMHPHEGVGPGDPCPGYTVRAQIPQMLAELITIETQLRR